MTHYLRGKALMIAARYVEARESLELAVQLAPKLVEAMLLRTDLRVRAARAWLAQGASRR